MSWNDEVRIHCEFQFKCPKQWEHLTETGTAGVRHCSDCNRHVYLAETEEHFRAWAGEQRCVAVRVLSPQSEPSADLVYMVGSDRF